MTKMEAKGIFGKNSFFHRKKGTDFQDSWFVAFGNLSNNSLFKIWPWVDLDLFHGNVKFCKPGFSKKSEQSKK